MQYVPFGKTGVQVSRLGFGGAPAGLSNYLEPYDAGSAENRALLHRAIERALQLGITYFDTAPGYGNGISEEIFGDALQAHRKSIFIATKAFVGTPDDLRRSVEQSLTRLRTDQIDLLQIHGNSYHPALVERILNKGGVADQLHRLKEEGLVRFTGFTSEDNNDGVYRLIQSEAFDVMQLCYNFIFQHPYEPSRPFGSLYEAEKAGMGIATMRATTSGTFQRWLQMVNPNNTFNYTPALIQFVLSNPLVDVVLIGMRDSDIVEENVAICNNLDGRIDLSQLHERYV